MAIYTPKDLHLSKIKRYWELLHVLAEREIKIRYRGSLLGVYWSLFNPLIMTGLYTMIFGALFKKYYHNSLIEYMLAAFTGLTVIHFYQGSTSLALPSVVSNGSLLNKIRLPVSVFPTSIIIANTFQLLVGMLPVLVIVTLVLSPHPILSIINVITIPIALSALVLVSAGIAFLVSALFVFFRDLPFFYELIQFVLWLSSPVFYPAEIVVPAIRPILAINPLYPIIQSLRQIVLSGDLPNLTLILQACLSGIIILGIGWTVFHWLRPKFMDLL
jgi:ABC-type polysaccharide/polyol phosphate export permease